MHIRRLTRDLQGGLRHHVRDVRSGGVQRSADLRRRSVAPPISPSVWLARVTGAGPPAASKRIFINTQWVRRRRPTWASLQACDANPRRVGWRVEPTLSVIPTSRGGDVHQDRALTRRVEPCRRRHRASSARQPDPPRASESQRRRSSLGSPPCRRPRTPPTAPGTGPGADVALTSADRAGPSRPAADRRSSDAVAAPGR
jgi:hypothetical protein